VPGCSEGRSRCPLETLIDTVPYITGKTFSRRIDLPGVNVYAE
jgi:hypothetical protein